MCIPHDPGRLASSRLLSDQSEAPQHTDNESLKKQTDHVSEEENLRDISSGPMESKLNIRQAPSVGPFALDATLTKS